MAIGNIRDFVDARFWSVMGAVAAALCSLAVLAADASGQSATLTKVLLPGDSLGGGVGGNTFSGASRATIGSTGHMVIIGSINSGARGAVILKPVVGPPSIIAASGAAPGGTLPPGVPAGVTFANFVDAWADASGRVFIFASLAGPGITTADDIGFFVHNGTSLVQVAREGAAPPTTVPGLPAGTLLTTLGNPVFSNGRAAFVSGLSGGGTTTINDQALWFWNGTSLALVFRKGGASVVAGATWAGLGGVLINSAGSLAFIATVNSGSSATDSVVVVGTPSGVPLDTFALVAREGSQAPGAAAGVVFTQDFATSGIGQGGLSLNDSGEVLFHGVLSSAAGSGTWRRSGGITSGVLRSTDIVPPGIATPSPALGTPQDETLGSAGVLAWSSTAATGAGGVTVDNDRVLFRKFGAPITPLLREGTQPPGEAADITFGPTGQAFFINFSINGPGAMLIEADLTRVGTTGPIAALWGSDPAVTSTRLFKLARNGDDVALIGIPGMPVGKFSIPTISRHGNMQQGQAASLNDGGAYVLLASITPPGVSVGGPGTVRGVFTGRIEPGTAVGACCHGAKCSVTTGAACAALGSGSHFNSTATFCNAAGNLLTPCCFADFNGSGPPSPVSVQDVFDFLAAFFAGDLRADINGSGVNSVQDVFDFLAAFFAGCG